MAFELKHLLYCAGVIICIGLLFSLIPNEISTTWTTTPPIPNAYPGVELGGFEETEVFMNNDTEFSVDAGAYRVRSWDLGGVEWVMFQEDSVFVSWTMIGIKRTFFGIWVDTEWMTWRNETGYDRGTNLTLVEMDKDDNVDPYQVKYTVVSGAHPELSSTVYIWTNDSSYFDVAIIWARHEAYILQGVGVNNDTLSLSGFAFFLQLLTFQTPNIHPWVNILLWAVIGVPTAYVVFELIRSLIPFLS